MAALLAALLALVSLIALTALTALTPGAEARPGRAQRADLVVRSGAVAQTGTTLTGSFTVKDKGPRAAGRSSASLTLTGPGAPTVVATYAVAKVQPRKARTVAVSTPLPAGLAAGTWTATVCADTGSAVREKREQNNCRAVGTVAVSPAGPTSSVPTAPLTLAPGAPTLVRGAGADYWAVVPPSYDATHRTPTKTLVWMHGCGGYAEGDASLVSPGVGQDWVSLSIGGRDGDCWSPGTDTATVLAALADAKTHFNLDPRRVVIGGYSSGGDLAYRTAFSHARLFAGLIAENTSPFRDTGSSQAQSLAAASWRFPVVHLAHTQDDVYPIGPVKAELGAMSAAGHPVTLVERPGQHYDDPGQGGRPGTDADLRTYLLPALGLGWLAP